jgi:UDP-glucose 4-epimerase
MTTLVTGAFGCIGSWVTRELLAAGERPVLFDFSDDPWRLRMIAGADVTGRATIVRGDIADREQVARIVGAHRIRRILHLAAWQVPLCRQDPSRGALVNVVGTANVFEAVRAHRASDALSARPAVRRGRAQTRDPLRRVQGRERGNGPRLLGRASDSVLGIPTDVRLRTGT